MYKRIFLGILVLMSIISCQHKDKLDVDVSKISAKVKIRRFDKDFFGKTPNEFPKIKQKYPYIFPKNSPDSIWIKKMNDSLFLKLKLQVDSVFPDLKPYKPEISNLWKHIKYYYPTFKEPKIITIYSDWNYLNRAVYADSLMLISLDNFLGENNMMYTGNIPKYIRQTMTPKHLIVEMAKSIINTQVAPPKNRELIYKIINEGKKMYLLDAYLPEKPDRIKLGYTEKKLKWAKQNEEMVWKYFITNNLLYQNKNDLERRFLNPAPYSKFYTEEDINSPGQIGIFIGRQIVHSFMQNNDVSLQKMILLPEEEIFKKSKYKPRK